MTFSSFFMFYSWSGPFQQLQYSFIKTHNLKKLTVTNSMFGLVETNNYCCLAQTVGCTLKYAKIMMMTTPKQMLFKFVTSSVKNPPPYQVRALNNLNLKFLINLPLVIQSATEIAQRVKGRRGWSVINCQLLHVYASVSVALN